MKKLKLLQVKKVTRIEINSFIQKKAREIVPKLRKKEVHGATPPEIFVGRFGYPKVYIGPLVPPIEGDTSFLARTEYWWGRTLEDIIEMRIQMLRGKKKVNVKDLNNRYAEKLREMVLSRTSVDSEMKLKKLPIGVSFSYYHQPFGPSAPIEDFEYWSARTDFKIEKAFSDTDLKAVEAVKLLYQKGVEVSRIQQALSAGLLGIGKNRRFVPTRWSITAVDDIIGKALVEKVKDFPLIDEYIVYYMEYLDNRWIIWMFPENWSYESIEAWYPGTLLSEFAIGGDYEGFGGRSTYASIGGCYYSGRLAVAEKLVAEKRQASVLILREIHPGYAVPVGVWNVRETVRRALASKPFVFENFEKSLEFVKSKLEIPIKVWIENSVILKKKFYQNNLKRFFKKI